MKKEWADKWVKALRSGEYKQGTGKLQQGENYCCLGVLCKILPKELVELSPKKKHIKGIYLPKKVKNYVQLYDKQGTFTSFGRQNSLSNLNDIDLKTFEEIADIIEKEWENL